MAPGEDDEKQELSLREQLARDFDAVGDTPDPDLGEAVEAPEAEEPAIETTDRPRDEAGRFTKAEREQAAKDAAAAAQAPQEGQQVEEKPAELRMAPPPGWAPAAKAAFKELPPVVQEAVARREEEVNRGFQKLQEFKGLEPYAEMARNAGTTLSEAYERYVAAEQALDQDFPGGVAELCNTFGMHPMQLAQMLAERYGGQVRQPNGQPQPQGNSELGLLARELSAMKAEFGRLMSERQQQEEQAINGELERFAQDHIYFHDVRQEMGRLIREGKAQSLEEAYEDACWSHRDIRPLLIKEQAASGNSNGQSRVDQHRRASGSLPTGSPLPGATPPTNGSAKSIRGALLEAWDSSV